jgi:GntR family histidine utilization transcriptional repressor
MAGKKDVNRYCVGRLRAATLAPSLVYTTRLQSLAHHVSNSRPKFENIVHFARRRIRSGSWKPGDRAPSENELSERFGVSRMTARRALDQLARAGDIVRRQGAGSFIADDSVRSSFLVIRNIAEEVADTGQRYGNRIVRHCTVSCDAEVAVALDLERGAPVYHSLITHLADEKPVQLEYRYVRPDAAPEFLEADLTLETPNRYLQRICPLVEARQEISATLPKAKHCELLEIQRNEPCLLITRVTSAARGLVSFARILAPASRYRLAGRLHFTSQISP